MPAETLTELSGVRLNSANKDQDKNLISIANPYDQPAFNPFECRIRTNGLWKQISSRLNAHWQTDWAIEDQA